MPVQYMEKIKAKYMRQGFEPYRWTVNRETPPFKPLAKPLSGCRLGLVASGGVYVEGQIAYHYKDDTSFRTIPVDVKIDQLRITHFAYDLRAARSDPNVIFPLDALRSLQEEGLIGSLAANFYGFMGGIYSARRVEKELAPPLVDRLLAEKVDALLLVPV